MIIFHSFQEWNLVQDSKKSGAGTSDLYSPKWEFYPDLEFLIPTLVVKEGRDSMALFENESSSGKS